MSSTIKLFSAIENTIQVFDCNQISEERKVALQPLVDFIQSKVSSGHEIRLNFICTHNSRRSHLSQVWAQTAAAYYNVKNVWCYSGGTEATALFPMAAETLAVSGFQVATISDGRNPVYAIKFAANSPAVIGFSKTYDHRFNPQSGFAAILTCSQADGACPFIAGAETRIAVPFEDPKVSDGTAQQKEIYRHRSLEIATDMFYVFSKINQ